MDPLEGFHVLGSIHVEPSHNVDLETERLKRDLEAMLNLDAAAAKASLKSIEYTDSPPMTNAVIRVQSWWRQYQARKLFAELMLEKFEADEAKRQIREQRLVEDTLQLLDRLALQTRLANNEYLTKCRKNHQNRVAYSIQRLFRQHSSKRRPKTSLGIHSAQLGNTRPDSN